MNEKFTASPPPIYLNAQELFLFNKIKRITQRRGHDGEKAEDVALGVIKKRRQQKLMKSLRKVNENRPNRSHY
jgi:hypothetical protein